MLTAMMAVDDIIACKTGQDRPLGGQYRDGLSRGKGEIRVTFRASVHIKPDAKVTPGIVPEYVRDWYGVAPITVPFYHLFYAVYTTAEPLSNSLKNWFYFVLTLEGLWILWKHRHEILTDSVYRAESLFFIPFSGFCV